MHNWIVNHHLSRWLLIASLVLTAVMMNPGFAALLVVGLNAGILIIMRKAAMLEGRAIRR